MLLPLCLGYVLDSGPVLSNCTFTILDFDFSVDLLCVQMQNEVKVGAAVAY